MMNTQGPPDLIPPEQDAPSMRNTPILESPRVRQDFTRQRLNQDQHSPNHKFLSNPQDPFNPWFTDLAENSEGGEPNNRSFSPIEWGTRHDPAQHRYKSPTPPIIRSRSSTPDSLAESATSATGGAIRKGYVEEADLEAYQAHQHAQEDVDSFWVDHPDSDQGEPDQDGEQDAPASPTPIHEPITTETNLYQRQQSPMHDEPTSPSPQITTNRSPEQLMLGEGNNNSQAPDQSFLDSYNYRRSKS